MLECRLDQSVSAVFLHVPSKEEIAHTVPFWQVCIPFVSMVRREEIHLPELHGGEVKGNGSHDSMPSTQNCLHSAKWVSLNPAICWDHAKLLVCHENQII